MAVGEAMSDVETEPGEVATRSGRHRRPRKRRATAYDH
jgi:hypothetical protein